MNSSVRRPFARIRLWAFIAGCLIVTVAVSLVALRLRYAYLRFNDAHRMWQIRSAMFAYERDYHALPPAYTIDQHGNKLHSWRTLLLPYLGQASLYAQIDLSRPWDSPENAAAYSVSPPIFQSQSNISGQTLFRVIVDPNGLFSGASSQALPALKVASKTILLVQSGTEQSTHWMDPEDYSLSQFNALRSSDTAYENGFTHVVLADGSIKWLNIQQATSQEIQDMVPITHDR